jgi:hypothetical protein
VLRAQLELKATKAIKAIGARCDWCQGAALKVTRAIKVMVLVQQVQLELQALKVTRAIKVM